MGTPSGSLPIQYSRLPLRKKRMSNNDWQSVVEKVERHLEGWQTKGCPGGAIGAGTVNPFGDTSVPPLNIQSASRS